MFFSRSFRSGVAAGFLCCLSFACGAASPPEVTLKDFRTRVHEWFAEHAGESSLELLRNESASADLNDLLWQLQVLVNQGAALTGFEDVGIHAQEDGSSVSFELERFPQWNSFERLMPVVGTPEGFRGFVPVLKQ